MSNTVTEAVNATPEKVALKKIVVRKAGPVRLTGAAHALYGSCGNPTL